MEEPTVYWKNKLEAELKAKDEIIAHLNDEIVLQKEDITKLKADVAKLKV